FGLDLAKGDYIIFFDDDDIVHPKNLALCYAELKNSEYDFCRYKREVFHGDFCYNFGQGEEYSKFNISENDLLEMLNNQLPFNSCAVMWRATCFKNNRFAEHL